MADIPTLVRMMRDAAALKADYENMQSASQMSALQRYAIRRADEQERYAREGPHKGNVEEGPPSPLDAIPIGGALKLAHGIERAFVAEAAKAYPAWWKAGETVLSIPAVRKATGYVVTNARVPIGYSNNSPMKMVDNLIARTVRGKPNWLLEEGKQIYPVETVQKYFDKTLGGEGRWEQAKRMARLEGGLFPSQQEAAIARDELYRAKFGLKPRDPASGYVKEVSPGKYRFTDKYMEFTKPPGSPPESYYEYRPSRTQKLRESIIDQENVLATDPEGKADDIMGGFGSRVDLDAKKMQWWDDWDWKLNPGETNPGRGAYPEYRLRRLMDAITKPVRIEGELPLDFNTMKELKQSIDMDINEIIDMLRRRNQGTTFTERP